MIPQNIIDRVLSLHIEDVIGKYTNLKRAGVNLKGLCPLHGEKTASFTVNTSNNFYKCFGCGKGGNAINFIMEKEVLSYPDAIKFMCKNHNIAFEEKELSNEEKNAGLHRESLTVVCKIAENWFRENLIKPEHISALEYVRGRWNDESIELFKIGYAPDGYNNFKDFAKEKGLKFEILVEAGILKEKDSKIYDAFRNRIMFPIYDKWNRCVGFTGRDISGNENTAKYLNTSESDIYSKGDILYGLNLARRAVKEKGHLHLVEGNPDVIRLHEIGKPNTVGTCGTSLTEKQIAAIKEITTSVSIIGDSDKAGKKAVERSGEQLLKSGLFVNVIPLPDTDEKSDPDSFFSDGDRFDTYAKSNLKDFIIWKVASNKEKALNPDKKSRLIDDTADLISHLPESSHEVYIEQLSKIIKPKKAWTDALKNIKKENEPVKDDGFKIPESISLSDFEKYGFYEDNNCYYFKTAKGVLRGTNFTMVPLFHISSVLNAKRLYIIQNEFGFKQVIELAQKDLIGLAGFKLRVESLGNFIFEASEAELNRLKRYLYEKTNSCQEITQLGWQKQGFFAWSNGLFDGKFKETDANGIVQFRDDYYYLPSNSNIYNTETSLFISERKFRFTPGKISFKEYASKLHEVFGDNAMFGIAFLLGTLFRDHISKLFGFFPILNIFGPKGAGKTELAISLLEFFGHQGPGPNILNTTRAAMADHVAMFSNSLCHIEEYKNTIESEKVEFLKGLWNGTGRTRMNMDKDRKKETTHVDAGIILTGQEMPTADIALFSRLVFLTFEKTEFSDDEKERFFALRTIEKESLTHITHEVLLYREYFVEQFMKCYNHVASEINKMLDGMVIEDRIYRNWLIIITSYMVLELKLDLPFSRDHFMNTAKEMILRQNHETKKSNELSVFWSIVEFLVNDGSIKEEVDFKLDFVDRLKTDMVNVDWKTPRNVIYINHSRLFQLYRIHGKKTGESILPIKTLEYYLQHSKNYLGKKMSVAFKVEENGRIVQDVDIPFGDKSSKRRITTAMCFDYDKLNISITSILPNEDVPPF